MVVEYQRRKGEEEVREVLEGVRRQSEVAQMQVQAQMQAAGLGGYGAGGYAGVGGGGGYGLGGVGGYNSYYNYISSAYSVPYSTPGAPPTQPPTGGGEGGGGGGDHATKMDAITSVATLLNTGISILGGGGFGLGN